MTRTPDKVDEMLDHWSAERPDLDTTGMAVVLRVQLLAGVFSDRLKAILGPAGLAPFEYDVLSALRRLGKGGSLSSKELCHSAQLSSGAMTHRLDRLEERGLIRRKQDPEDRRRVAVSLTLAGHSQVDQVVGDRMADALESLGGLSDRQVKDLARLLRGVCNAVEQHDAGG